MPLVPCVFERGSLTFTPEEIIEMDVSRMPNNLIIQHLLRINRVMNMTDSSEYWFSWREDPHCELHILTWRRKPDADLLRYSM